MLWIWKRGGNDDDVDLMNSWLSRPLYSSPLSVIRDVDQDNSPVPYHLPPHLSSFLISQQRPCLPFAGFIPGTLTCRIRHEFRYHHIWPSRPRVALFTVFKNLWCLWWIWEQTDNINNGRPRRNVNCNCIGVNSFGDSWYAKLLPRLEMYGASEWTESCGANHQSHWEV